MRRTMALITYLSLLATIGSFIVSALALLMERGEGTRCSLGPDDEIRALERQAPLTPKETVRSKNENSSLQQPLGMETRMLTQETPRFAWRTIAVTLCATAVVLCVIGILTIGVLRWMGFET